MPIGKGKEWIYRLLFACESVCVFVLLWISPEDKARGVKFCGVFHWSPGQGISHFGGTLLPQKPKSDVSASLQATRAGSRVGIARALADSSSELATCRISECGWSSVPTDVLVIIIIIKTLEFVVVGQIREFCESCNVRKKFTAIIIAIVLVFLLGNLADQTCLIQESCVCVCLLYPAECCCILYCTKD